MRGRVKSHSCLRRRGALTAFVVAAGLTLAPAQAGAVSFFRGDFPVGTNPTSIAVGNFNGGASDLAVTNEGDDSVSVLLGDGFGRFAPGASVSVGDAPSSVVTGNFNGDALMDLAVANVGSDNLSILLGDGAGAFTPAGTVSTGTNSDPRAIASGDFNNDGHSDLVSANQSSNTVSVHLGDGMGAFAADPTPRDVSSGSSIPAVNPIAIAAIQLGGTVGSPETNLDVLVASQASDQLLELLGDGTGEFTGAGTLYTSTGLPGTDPSAVAVGSLNPGSSNPGNAAEPDFLVANVGPDQVWPAYGRTDGSFFDFGGVLPTGAGSDPVGLAMGDLDGDGDQDGISANSGTGSATVILSDGGGGTSVDTTTTVGSSPRAVGSGAFDADARADAAVANYSSDSVTVLTSLTPGPPPASTPPTPVKPKKKCKKKKGKKKAGGAKKKKKQRKCKKRKKRKKRK